MADDIDTGLEKIISSESDTPIDFLSAKPVFVSSQEREVVIDFKLDHKETKDILS
jgi:hypothetical protein